MKIIHLTDTHLLGADRANVYGINSAYRIKRAFKSIMKSHKDADFIAITGDLVDISSPAAYKLLRNVIDKSDIPVFPILGNHDTRKDFSIHFPKLVQNDFVQYVHKVDNKVFLFLDTLVEGERYGKLCKSRLAWLDEKLEKYKKNTVCIFMHHHPVDSGLYEMDNVADFRSKKEFWKIVDKYSNVAHISFGHIHRILHACRGNVSMHATRSTTFQVAYQPDSKLEYLTNKEKPTYAVIEILDDDIFRINHHEYLYEKIYYEDGER